MIKRINVKNYRSLANVSVELEKLTVLVGINGSGKSNVADVIRFVTDAMHIGLDVAINRRMGMGALRRWSAKGRPYDVEISLDVETESFKGNYAFVLGSEKRGEYSVKAEECTVQDPSGNYTYKIEKGVWSIPPPGLQHVAPTKSLFLPFLAREDHFGVIYQFLAGISFYSMYPSTLRERQRPDNPYPLTEDGANLLSLLKDLQENQQGNIMQALKRVIPDLLDYKIEQVGPSLVGRIKHDTVEADRSPWFDLGQESDGTLRMLSIMAALYQSPPRAVILLEEPELTVHPGAMVELWQEIRRASQKTQILVTTHSPDLLDLCSDSQIRVVEKINGVSEIGFLEDAQREIIQKKLFAPGQLLQAQGLNRAQE